MASTELIFVNIAELIEKSGFTKYRFAIEANIAHTTLNDICSGKAKIEKCSAETIYKIAKTLNVSMEMLVRDAIIKKEMERSCQYTE